MSKQSSLENKLFQVENPQFQKKIDEIKAYYEKNKENLVKENIILAQHADKLTLGLNKCALDLKNAKKELENLKLDSKNRIEKLTKENNDLKIEKDKLIKRIKINLDFTNESLKNKTNDEIYNESSIIQKDKIILDHEKKEEIDNINKIKELEKKVKTLENNIKEMEIKLKEKEKIINEGNLNLNKQINGNQSSSNSNFQVNRISELENEIKQLKSYILSPGEKLIYIKFISVDQTINFSTVAKTNDKFTKIESIVYNNYPDYEEYENYFLVNGRKINKNKTIEENSIKDKDVLTLLKIDDDN